MAIVPYKSSSSRRIFTNYPFINGMSYTDLALDENLCRISANLDFGGSGDYGQPRPAFINAVLHSGFNTISLPVDLMKQTTNLGKTFLIGSNYTVNETDYVTQTVGTDVSSTLATSLLLDDFGLKITAINGDILEFTNGRGVKELYYPSVSEIDGDTIVCKDTVDGDEYSVRLLGIDAPDDDEPLLEGFAATFVRNTLAASESIYLIFDSLSDLYDPYERVLAYVFYKNAGDDFYCNLNTEMLLMGYANIAFLNPDFIYADKMLSAHTDAVENERGFFADPPGLFPDGHLLETERESWVYEYTLPDEYEEGSFFKKEVYTSNTIDLIIYDTHSYFEPTKVATDIFTPDGEDIVIQILVNEYTSTEYEYTQNRRELPYANQPWRNAITFFGRLVEGGILRYKGMITLQYDGSQHYILLQKAYEVNLGTFNYGVATSFVFNALDDDPYIYEDYYGTDASAFLRPSILGVYLYDRDISDSNAKLYTSVNKYQQAYLRPYVAIPAITDDAHMKTEMRVLLNDIYTDLGEEIAHNYAWVEVLGVGVHTAVEIEAAFEIYFATLDKPWDFTINKEEPIQVELRQAFDETAVGVYEWQGGTPQDYRLNVSSLVADGASIDTSFRYSITSVVDSQVQGPYTIFSLEFTVKNLKTETTKVVKFYGDYLYEADMEYRWQAGHLFNIEFEDLNFELEQYQNVVPIDIDAYFTVNVVLDVHITSNVTMPLRFMSIGETIDPNDLLNSHKVWDATRMLTYDRYVILYGSHMGESSLQFSEYDRTDNLPFPFGQITFDAKIIHVHPHHGNLYVFCTDGLWILHDGNDPLTMIKTFAYAGAVLKEVEKHTVISFGNEVIYVSKGKVYSIRTNHMIESTSDVYVMPISFPIDRLLSNPQKHVQERLQNAYGILVESTTELHAQYFTFTTNSELHIVASYHIKDPNQQIMITYIYDRDNRTWRTYDTVAAGFPLFKMNSSEIKGFDLICANRHEDGLITYASYMYELPNRTDEWNIGDARSVVYTDVGEWELADDSNEIIEAVIPIQILLDSGSLNFNSLHKKRVRKFIFTFSNPEGQDISYKLIPFMDGIPQNNAVTVEALIDEYGEVIETLIQEADLGEIDHFDVVTIQVNELGGTSLIDAKFTTASKFELRLKTNITGRLPGFQLYLQAPTRFKLLNYGIQYRQFSAR